MRHCSLFETIAFLSSLSSQWFNQSTMPCKNCLKLSAVCMIHPYRVYLISDKFVRKSYSRKDEASKLFYGQGFSQTPGLSTSTPRSTGKIFYYTTINDQGLTQTPGLSTSTPRSRGKCFYYNGPSMVKGLTQTPWSIDINSQIYR